MVAVFGHFMYMRHGYKILCPCAQFFLLPILPSVRCVRCGEGSPSDMNKSKKNKIQITPMGMSYPGWNWTPDRKVGIPGIRWWFCRVKVCASRSGGGGGGGGPERWCDPLLLRTTSVSPGSGHSPDWAWNGTKGRAGPVLRARIQKWGGQPLGWHLGAPRNDNPGDWERQMA